jgi:hypothetical protein
VVDLQEMYEAQRPFTLAALASQVRLLNAYLFAVLPAAAARSVGDTSSLAVDAPLWQVLWRLCAWLRLLRTRDEVRPLCTPPLSWALVSPNRAADFTAELLAGLPGPAAVLQWMPWVVPFSVRLHVFRTTVRIHVGGGRGSDDDGGDNDSDTHDQSASLGTMLRTLWAVAQGRNRPGSAHQATVPVPGAPLPSALPAVAMRPVPRAGPPLPPTYLTLRRSHLVLDASRAVLALSPAALQRQVRVRFINAEGLPEPGIDQRGVFKEFLEETVKALLAPATHLAEATPARTLLPLPAAQLEAWAALVTTPELAPLRLWQLLGRLLGKAVREDLVLDVPLAPVFLGTLQGARPTLTDLAAVDPELYRSLLMVKDYTGDLDDLALTFAVTHIIPTAGTPEPARLYRAHV